MKYKRNPVKNLLKEIVVENFLNLLNVGYITLFIFQVLLVCVVKYFFGSSRNGSTFLMMRALIETFCQIYPSFVNPVFRYGMITCVNQESFFHLGLRSEVH